jgi:hypothetical protein
MRRAILRCSVLSLVFAAILAPVLPAAQPQIDWGNLGPLPVFELHGGFWLNLHHELYRDARIRLASRGASAKNRASEQLMPNLTPTEQTAWDSAVAFYADNYAHLDLQINLDLALIKNQLADFETCPDLTGATRPSCNAGLPEDLTRALETAAPVYRAHLWPQQDRINRRWIATVAPLVRSQGLEVAQRLAEIYQTHWPKERIRVDVSGYAGDDGAYTTLDPLRLTISSIDPRNQGGEAFEVLFHEASHGIAGNVQAAINRECRQRDKPIPRDLWHALIFYTTGQVIKKALAPLPGAPPVNDPMAQPVVTAPYIFEDYTPYAVHEGLYKRGWENYLDVLTRFWQPYLDGRSTFDDAVARMISSL